ncbi:MAG: divalent-cation tolerance protein CutA [Planctomycetota bacterium]
MDNVVVVLTTVADQGDAKRLSLQLVQRGFAACVQIDGPVESCYSWEGKLETTAEYRLTIKTVSDKWDALEAWLLEHHPYDQPQLIALPATHVTGGYANWVRQQTAS